MAAIIYLFIYFYWFSLLSYSPIKAKGSLFSFSFFSFFFLFLCALFQQMSGTAHTCFDLHNWKCNTQDGMKNIQMSMDMMGMGWLPVISCEKLKSRKSFLSRIPELTNSCKKGFDVFYLLVGKMKNQHQQGLKKVQMP